MTSRAALRLDWDDYFLAIAATVSQRSTCNRLQVGCVLASREMQVLATGYGGSMRGAAHCTDVGCLIIDGGCKRTVHAEQNAVCQAAAHGVRLEKATAYITDSPCRTCGMLLVNAGVQRIVFTRLYRVNDHLDELRELGIQVVHSISDISGTSKE